jgi:hypothetical protein
MTDAQIVWTPAAREAVAFGQREAWRDEADIRDETLNWPDIEDEDRECWLKGADAALAALAPFVAAREAAAFKRGAEAMRTSTAQWADCSCDQRAEVLRTLREKDGRAAQKRCGNAGTCCALVATCMTALPIPEDKP